MLYVKFRGSGPRGFEEVFGPFPMYSFGSKLGPLDLGHLGPWDLRLNELGERQLGHAIY